MGMSIKRALTLRDEAVRRVIDLDSQSRIFGLSHDVICARIGEIMSALDKAPQWARAYVSGYARCIADRQYAHDLVWCHVAPDGTRYTAHAAESRPDWAQDVRPLYEAGRGLDIASWPHAHFWKNGKPFYTPMTSAEFDAAYKARIAVAKES